MKTDDLIAALAADETPPAPTPRRMLWLAVVGGALAACIAFFVLLGPRPDFMQAIETVRFVFKFVVSLALAASAFVALRRAMRPEMGARPLHAVLFVAPALLIAALVLEMLAVPASDWAARWIGHNWLYCMSFIPVLSLAPLAVLFLVLRSGASTAPVKTGAIAGLLAGGIGAVFYAAHCTDDSPLFVATWYTIAIGFMTGLGALCGARLLRW